MDLPRYLDIATRGRLFLSRQDKFRDTFEGAIPLQSRKALAMQSRALELEYLTSVDQGETRPNRPTLEKQMMSFLESVRREMFISCWHMNSAESAAMWDLYGKDGSAIAFRTSYEKLRDHLPSNSYLGMVKYIDFENDYFSLDNAMNPSMNKRRSFEHENEVRAVINKPVEPFEGSEEYEVVREMTEFGITIPFKINEVIDEIYLSPDAMPWFVRLILETNAKLGVTAPLRKSSLYDAAIF